MNGTRPGADRGHRLGRELIRGLRDGRMLIAGRTAVQARFDQHGATEPSDMKSADVSHVRAVY